MQKVQIKSGVTTVVFVRINGGTVHVYSPACFGMETWCGVEMSPQETEYIGRRHPVAQSVACATCWRLTRAHPNFIDVDVCVDCNVPLLKAACVRCDGTGQESHQHPDEAFFVEIPCPDCHPQQPCVWVPLAPPTRHLYLIHQE